MCCKFPGQHGTFCLKRYPNSTLCEACGDRKQDGWVGSGDQCLTWWCRSCWESWLDNVNAANALSGPVFVLAMASGERLGVCWLWRSALRSQAMGAHRGRSVRIYCNTQDIGIQYCMVLYCNVLYCNAVKCIVLNCIVLYCIGSSLSSYPLRNKHIVFMLTRQASVQ